MRVIGLIEQAYGRRADMELLPMQSGDVSRSFADIDEMQREPGHDASTAIEVGVTEFVHWYRAYHGV